MIRLIRPQISFDDVESQFREILGSGILTRGKYVDAFCEDVRKCTGADFAYPATSATTALWLCLKLLEIGPGDEVVVSDFSFPATANVVEDLGAMPIFADVLPDSYNMDPEALLSVITSKTRAVIFVDAFGNPTGIHEIASICREKGLTLIEDAACAMGSSENGNKCGSVADLGCFSFHPRKLITTGEGGAITTNNADWNQWFLTKLNHGAGEALGCGFEFIDYGYNFRMSELQAAMGSVQLRLMDSIVTERNLIRDQYKDQLEAHGFQAQMFGDGVQSNVQSLVFRVPDGVNRDKLVFALREKGVESTLGTYCLSGTRYYRQKYDSVQPNSELLQITTISLPCYREVPVDQVCEAIITSLPDVSE